MRTLLFEDESIIEIEIEVDYSYLFTRGRTCGPPELCYPDEESYEVTYEEGWRDKVRARYAELAAEMIKKIEDYQIDADTVACWAGEDAEAEMDARAEEEFDRRREYEAE